MEGSMSYHMRNELDLFTWETKPKVCYNPMLMYELKHTKANTMQLKEIQSSSKK
jgi:hypothetical protein